MKGCAMFGMNCAAFYLFSELAKVVSDNVLRTDRFVIYYSLDGFGKHISDAELFHFGAFLRVGDAIGKYDFGQA